MKRKLLLSISGLVVAATIGTAIAQQNINPAVNARQSVMQLYAYNLTTLGAMAKGDIDYDAAIASGAAGNLAALSTLDQSTFWPMGSDNGNDPDTRALPALWENFPDVGAKAGDLVNAAAARQDAAGQDLASLRGAMGALGGACAACHKAYRAPAE